MKINSIIILLVVIWLSPSFAFASWIKLSPEELIEQSKLAVIGEFIGTTRLMTQKTGKNLIAGIIKVDDFLDGSVSDDFLLIVIGHEGDGLISTTINFKKGQKGLWLLQLYSPDNPVLYSASQPQQFTPSSDLATINELKNLLIEHKEHN
ncbi:hypothetical protein [Colwellia hornerae]|uniref:Uncharacterized protein n=1 Tax=Colwellia hornerae TaxID=89402 RepID=A0A5C6QA53_9GAMM|nr:hypothetical protein [Colwellia hornerae]TWX59567.1 hypothetical protein ESZ28_01090 [Colwellia hornerae]TWX62937.1 hypothetical protein ESZ26_01085 [Colwellia hornerae]TWX65779.1 hypothetical protein ESZ27_11635 [Colwellia hornerae]